MVDIILRAFESMNKKEKTDGIRLPVTIVIILALAVLGIILGQVADVIDYCQEEEPRILRIVIRSISTFGWALVEWYLLDEMWQYYRRKKVSKPHEAQPEPEETDNV